MFKIFSDYLRVCFFYFVRFVVLFFFISLGGILAFQSTTCDCDGAKMKGFLNFNDDDCKVVEDPTPPKPVTYSLFSHIPESKRFSGYMCSTADAYRSVSTDFAGFRTVEQHKTPRNTSAAECKKLLDSKTCCGKPMDYVGDNKWEYTDYPVVYGYWLLTVHRSGCNCHFEVVTLSSTCPTCPIESPIGTIPGGLNGSISHNLITILWEESWREYKECKVRSVALGEGFLYDTTDPMVKRVQDRHNQTDYLVNVTLENVCNERLLQNVLGMDKVYMTLYAAPSTNLKLQIPSKVNASIVKPSLSSINGSVNNTLDTEVSRVLQAEIETAAHLQYARDIALDFENTLAREVRRLQCESRRINHHTAISTAQYNGWLAASHLDLPLCHTVSMVGLQAAVLQCVPKNVSFIVEITSCGPQPRFKDLTISTNGWELTPFVECYWHTNFVNFMGKSHAFSNGSWVPVFPSIQIQGRKLVDIHRFEADNSLGTLMEIHPLIRNNPLSPSSVMADILAIIEKHQSENVTFNRRISKVLLSPQEVTHVSFLHRVGNWLKNFGAFAGFGALSLLAFRFCGGGSLLVKLLPSLSILNPYSWCSSRPASTTSPGESIPMAQVSNPIVINVQPSQTPSTASTAVLTDTAPRPKRNSRKSSRNESAPFIPRH